jgi:hypothetical protein
MPDNLFEYLWRNLGRFIDLMTRTALTIMTLVVMSFIIRNIFSLAL